MPEPERSDLSRSLGFGLAACRPRMNQKPNQGIQSKDSDSGQRSNQGPRVDLATRTGESVMLSQEAEQSSQRVRYPHSAPASQNHERWAIIGVTDTWTVRRHGAIQDGVFCSYKRLLLSRERHAMLLDVAQEDEQSSSSFDVLRSWRAPSIHSEVRCMYWYLD